MEFNSVKIPRIRLKKNNNEQQTRNSTVNTEHSKSSQQFIKNNSNLIKMIEHSKANANNTQESSDDDEETIKPKKLVNPIKESVAMQCVHRELLLNQKIGYNVLKNKTELQRALEKLSTKPEKSKSPEPNITQQQSSSSSSKNVEFESILKARAKQIEEQKCFVDGHTTKPHPVVSEFEKIHKRITHNSGE